MKTSTAIAHPNIAFIKYWGNLDDDLRLPANSSLSMNLAELATTTQVSFSQEFPQDSLILNGAEQNGAVLSRASQFLDIIRKLSGMPYHARIISNNSFPAGAGIASSASAFAALALAASHAAGLQLSQAELSRLARRGSGSASRSIPAGFVEWQAGASSDDSYAWSIAPPEHWQLIDCIAIVSNRHKAVGSTDGHALARTSVLQNARVADAPRRMNACREAILERDFDRFTQIVEEDSLLMHAVMITSRPALFYWQPASLEILQSVRRWRDEGLFCAATMDAGPNVHVLCTAQHAPELQKRLMQINGVSSVLTAGPGGGAHLV